MGATGCKPAKSPNGIYNDDEQPEQVESVSIGKGVRVHQLDGNNFLGRLEDAARMSCRSQGLWRRRSSLSSAPKTCSAKGSAVTGTSSSARSSCYSELSSSVWQQQQQQQQQPQKQPQQQQQPQKQPQQQQQQQPPQSPAAANSNRRLLRQHFLSIAPTGAGTTMAPPSSRSLDCGGQVDRKSGSSSPDPESTEPEAEVDASRMDLTTLLLQGFDPTAYEQRLAERRLAKFTGRSRRQPRSILASTLTKTEATAGGTAAAATAAAEIPG